MIREPVIVRVSNERMASFKKLRFMTRWVATQFAAANAPVFFSRSQNLVTDYGHLERKLAEDGDGEVFIWTPPDIADAPKTPVEVVLDEKALAGFVHKNAALAHLNRELRKAKVPVFLKGSMIKTLTGKLEIIEDNWNKTVTARWRP